MLLGDLVATFRDVRATRSRNKKTALLAAALRAMAPDEVGIGVAYLTGDLPQGKVGLGWAAVRDTRDAVPAAAPSLTLRDVDRAFTEIAAMSGPGSGTGKRERLGALMAAATEGEQELLGRLVVGELRQGALEGVMIEAIAEAADQDAAEVRRAVMVSGDMPAVAKAALAEGAAGLAGFHIQLFRPVLPMLATPADDVAAVFELMDEAAFELKLDGARVQLHKRGADVRVFSRRQNDVTAAVPEVVEAAGRIGADEIILDGEVIALREDGAPYPFQHTMRRFGRKGDAALRAKMPLSVFFFDVLRVDGGDVIELPTRERVAAMTELVPADETVPRLITGEPGEAEAFWRDALDRGHEGVMAKALDAGYEAGSRGKSWLKLKPAHTLDLVVIAVEHGSGRRTGWLSNIHLGARDPATGSYVMLGKTFKGMTDEMLRWQTEYLSKIAIGQEGHVVHVEPKLVAEIAFSDVQASPHYPGGMALRFARVKRYRPDKKPEDADTIDAVRAIFGA